MGVEPITETLQVFLAPTVHVSPFIINLIDYFARVFVITPKAGGVLLC